MPTNTYTRLDDNGLLYLLTLLKDELANAGDENIIEAVKVNGILATPDANKAVNVLTPIVDFFTAAGDGKLNGFQIGKPTGTGGALGTPKVSFQSADGTNVKMWFNSASGIDNEYTLATKSYTDSTFRTEAQVQEAIDDAIAGITGMEFEIVQTLPQTGEKGIIYLMSNSGTGDNSYDEYIWIDGTPGRFEKIGSTSVDLSGYVQASEMHALTNAEIDAIFNQVFV